MQPLLQIELNEVNFSYVRSYCASNRLPTFSQLLAKHGIVETTSETEYSLLEPWIQWVTAHTGLDYEQHRVFRLGDIVDREDVDQIWEQLERHGLTVGAISPMNAENRLRGDGFFLPDPWTPTKAKVGASGQMLWRGAAALVNNNASGGSRLRDLTQLGLGLVGLAHPRRYGRYLSLIIRSLRKSWRRALILDQALADTFISLVRSKKPDFSTLFLNAAAHLQHHYMFNAEPYIGKQRNPNWYATEKEDPVYAVYKLYDKILQDIIEAFPKHRILIATGLHQDPYPENLFYWRLKDHVSFLDECGIHADRVEPRMSRDFVLFYHDTDERDYAAAQLRSMFGDDGIPLFEVDIRDGSLFVMLTYPIDISPTLGYRCGNQQFTNLRSKVSFVAIKNGEHNGIGYLIDTDRCDGIGSRQIPLRNLHQIALDHFGIRNLDFSG